MAIGDYLWPFERKFSQIPCAREAAIAALLGGPGLGAVTFMLTNKPRLTLKTIFLSGFGIFWISFLTCRSQYERNLKLSRQFREAQIRGKFD